MSTNEKIKTMKLYNHYNENASAVQREHLGAVNCPPRSCDLWASDFFLWRVLKHRAYAHNPKIIPQLKQLKHYRHFHKTCQCVCLTV